MNSSMTPEAQSIVNWIVKEFGNGVYEPSKYIFEQITRVPPNGSADRVAASKIVDSVFANSVVTIIFDPHPNNARFALHAARSLGLISAEGVITPLKEDLVGLLATHLDCDFILSDGKTKVAIPCHEDTVENGERQIWIASLED